MSNDYTRNAHRRTILAELQRVLMHRFLPQTGNPPRETLICEEVFYADREVTEEALLEILEDLQRRESDERIQMTQYEFRRRDVQKLGAKSAEEAKPSRGQEADGGEPGKEGEPSGRAGTQETGS